MLNALSFVYKRISSQVINILDYQSLRLVRSTLINRVRANVLGQRVTDHAGWFVIVNGG